MVELIGYFRGQSKDGKEFALISYSYHRDGMEWGDMAESCVCSQTYADKLISYVTSGGKLHRGWDREKGRPFLYIPKS